MQRLTHAALDACSTARQRIALVFKTAHPVWRMMMMTPDDDDTS
jgi:hypothetical protein